MRKLLILPLLSLVWSSCVQAAPLLRCEKDGNTAFVQKKLPGHSCRVVKQIASPSSRASVPASSLSDFTSSPNVPSSTPPHLAPLGLPPLPPGLSATTTKLADLPLSLPDTPALVLPALPSLPSASSTKSRGTIYRRVVNGVVEFSSKPVSGAQVAMRFVRECYACQAPRSMNFQSLPLDTQSYSTAIASAATKHAVDPAWVRAVVHAESNFNPQAVSPKGAQGLMQLMPATARRFGVSSPFEPAQNIAGGVEYLAWLLKRFKGDHRLATAAYNAGEGAVARHNGVPPYSETRLYVDRVATLRARYGSQ